MNNKIGIKREHNGQPRDGIKNNFEITTTIQPRKQLTYKFFAKELNFKKSSRLK